MRKLPENVLRIEPRGGGKGGPPAYTELRAASSFSFLDGASPPEDLITRAAELDLPAVALVDRNGIYGAPRFYRAAKQAGMRALVGAEVTVGDRNATPPATVRAVRAARRRSDPEEAEEQPPPLIAPPGADGALPDLPRLTLMVENRTGYKNLCRLISAAARERPKGDPRASWELVEHHARGLRCLTGGEEGTVARALRAEGLDGARRELERLVALFSGRVHVEIGRHHLREEEHANRALIDLARRLRLPLVATNGVRYAAPKDKPLFDVLTAIRHRTTLDAAGKLLAAHRERHVKSADEMRQAFADLPEALAGNVELAARLDFTLADLGYRFPDYPLPSGETPASYLRHITWNCAPARFRPFSGKAQAQIQKELDMIEKLDLAGYFLIVWDIVRFCLAENILAQGRGSAANSAVCYALSITAVDPVRMDLLFERFLSEERGEWPDIDLDLPSGAQREKVIQYVYHRYGPHGAAMTANVITYRDRSAARETAKALGYSPDQVDKLAKQLGRWSYDRSRGDQKSFDAELTTAGFDPAEPRLKLFTEMFEKIQHLPRHLGQHSGGMVIAAGRLDEVVPLEPAAMPGRTVIQWDKDDCADLGIVKVDLLGLGMLAALEEAVPTIRTYEKKHVDLAHLPADDPKVYRMLREADTVGVFQVESRAQMSALPRNRPEKFYDLVIQVAIIRPGPIAGNLANPYFERRIGREKVTYPHPSLEPILKRTLGVPIFQEQLLRIAMVAAGFTGGEAEELRRAMGFKRSVDRMRSIEARLRSGMAERGITGEAQDQIVQGITSFALYGFPESHAASFALIAYASAYLKAHHPTAFYLSLLNAWPMGFYHPATLIKDAERHGVLVRPLDVQTSGWNCRWEERDAPDIGSIAPARVGAELASARESEPTRRRVPPPGEGAGRSRGEERRGAPAPPVGAIRLGFKFVRGLRRHAAAAIEAEQATAPFASVEDLARRGRLHAPELETLASLGALEGLGGASPSSKRKPGLPRRAALWQAARVGRPAGPLLEALPDEAPSPLPEMTTQEKTIADYAGLQLTLGPHPVAFFREGLARHGVVPAADLPRHRDGERVRIAGSVIVRQRPGTAKGMLFLTLEDESGMCQAIVAPDLFQENRKMIVGNPGLAVEGKLQKRDGTLSVRAEKFWPLRDLAATPSHDFR
ncbi:MAG TPA: error-prone DNA polymerase [Thermoanaerobaculia bacterium]|nr:error-prone DNA polymerase [Thermoanaerobaculia bacterium]